MSNKPQQPISQGSDPEGFRAVVHVVHVRNVGGTSGAESENRL